MRFALGVIVVLALLYLVAWMTRPECPDGAVRALTRDGWYCTVKVLKR